MRRTVYILSIAAAAIAFAQARRVIGEVTSVDPAAGRIALKADGNVRVDACVNADSRLVRVPPGEKDLTKASPISLGDIQTGDRVLAIGPCPAARIVVMAKSDLAEKQQRESADWKKRGTAGVITALDPGTKEITLQTGTKPAVKRVVIESASGARFQRYPPGSIRFSDARPSSFEELHVGDQVRVLGNRTADGTRIASEVVVSGTFRTIAGIVSSVDVAKSEIQIKDLDTKKAVTILLTPDSRMKRIPEMAAAMMANRLHAAVAPPTNGGGRGGDFQEMLERFPTFTISELKAGEAVVLSGTKGEDPSQTTAAVILAGVEPLLRAAPASRDPLGGAWTFEIGLP